MLILTIFLLIALVTFLIVHMIQTEHGTSTSTNIKIYIGVFIICLLSTLTWQYNNIITLELNVHNAQAALEKSYKYYEPSVNVPGSSMEFILVPYTTLMKEQNIQEKAKKYNEEVALYNIEYRTFPNSIFTIFNTHKTFDIK